MAQSYRPYNDLNEIYKRKQIWADADGKGDDARKKKAAEEAKKYYRSLADNGYGSLSEEMRGAGLRQAKELTDYYGMEGKHPVREYLYTKGASKGLSKKDIDALLKYNGVTGEISFGGKNIGSPDSVVDGVSYMEDSKALDSSFDDYIKRAGVARSKTDAVNGENEKLFNMYEREYNDLKDINPFETD